MWTAAARECWSSTGAGSTTSGRRRTARADRTPRLAADAARRSPRWQRRLPAGRAPVSDPPADLQFAPQVHRLAPTVATALGDERIDRLQYPLAGAAITVGMQRSEEHTSALQSLMRTSYP